VKERQPVENNLEIDLAKRYSKLSKTENRVIFTFTIFYRLKISSIINCQLFFFVRPIADISYDG